MTAEGTAPQTRKGDARVLIVVLLLFGAGLGGFGVYRYTTGRASVFVLLGAGALCLLLAAAIAAAELKRRGNAPDAAASTA